VSVLPAFAAGVNEMGVVVLGKPHAPHQEEGVVFLRNPPLQIVKKRENNPQNTQIQ